MRLTPIIPTANMNLLVYGSTEIVVDTGSNRDSLVDVQLMICLLIVSKAVFMNRPMKTATTNIEQIPPDAVLYSGSY